MLEIAVGIILVVIILWMFPLLMNIALYLIPPAIGISVGALIGDYVAGGGGMLMGILVGLVGGIWFGTRLTRE